MVGGMKSRERKKDRGIGEGRVREWRIAGGGRRAGKEEGLRRNKGWEGRKAGRGRRAGEGRRVEEGGE